METLNDRYFSNTAGSENFKFKIKNVHEDNLFKNEDDMYKLDHTILQAEHILSKIIKEQENAKEWDERN